MAGQRLHLNNYKISFTLHCEPEMNRLAKDGHLVLVNGLEAYPGTVWLGAPTVS